MKNNKTILIMIDAVRPDYITQEYTPFLYDFSQKNTFLKLETLLGYSSGIHPSIYSGYYQDKTEKFVVFNYDPENSIFKWTKWLRLIPTAFLRKFFIAVCKVPYYYFPKKYRRFLPRFFRESIIKVPPSIPLEILPYFNMGSVKKRIRTIYDYFKENDISYTSVATARNEFFEDVQELDKLALTDALVDSFYIYEPDGYGHHYGANSQEIKEIMSKIDTKISELYTEAYHKYEHVDIFMFSDHGMYNVEKFLDIQTPLKVAGLQQPRDYIAFFDTTFARFWPKNDEIEKKIIQILEEIDGVRYLDDTLLKRYHLDFKDKQKFGKIMASVE
ncbi:MAG: alkaline phosphatase family protein [Candidatus Peribacteria bacterium]|nr:MAG: alkaline phosphatase family protein [Candidatus Peribacteria bacterium]